MDLSHVHLSPHLSQNHRHLASQQYWKGIVSYFQCRITQGAIEAINGIIQLAKRRARGFRNFSYLRTIAYWVAAKLKVHLPSLLPT